MEQRISVITLGVSDLARARKFYEQGLGWKSANPGNESIAFYQAGQMVFALFPRSALAAEFANDGNVPDVGTGFGGITLAHNVASRDEADALLAEAEAAGGKLLKPAQEAVWGGYSGYFADPDGHPWEVAVNPHWTLAEDGGVLMPKAASDQAG